MLDRRALVLIFAGCSTEGVNPVDGGVAVTEAGVPDARKDNNVHEDTGVNEKPILVDGPKLLSQTGLYADIKLGTIAPDVIPFAPRWSLWSDGAEKRRWVQLPQGQKIDTSSMDQWTFPIGTKMWKEFKVGNTVVETRFLWKVKDGGWEYWWMGAYRWRMDGTDADYVEQGEKNALGTTHDVPSQVDCVRCHNGVRDVGLGFSAIQLSAPQSSQLAKFASMGWYSNAPAQEWDAPGTGGEKDTLSYFHANCGHCHNEESWLYTKQTKLVLRLRTSDTTPQVTGAYAAIGMKTKHDDPVFKNTVFVAKQPDQSQAWLRMNVRDNGIWQMPPICTKTIDTAGVKLVGDWIAALP